VARLRIEMERDNHSEKDWVPECEALRAKTKLESLADKIGQLYEGCRSRGGYTDEALKFLESYRADTFPGTPEAYYNALMSEGSGTCQ
jgi:hypothetical protein